jgi:hypothetical protein
MVYGSWFRIERPGKKDSAPICGCNKWVQTQNVAHNHLDLLVSHFYLNFSRDLGKPAFILRGTQHALGEGLGEAQAVLGVAEHVSLHNLSGLGFRVLGVAEHVYMHNLRCLGIQADQC